MTDLPHQQQASPCACTRQSALPFPVEALFCGSDRTGASSVAYFSNIPVETPAK